VRDGSCHAVEVSAEILKSLKQMAEDELRRWAAW
jgi:hypothetical protein